MDPSHPWSTSRVVEETSSVDSESCWGEMEVLIGEGKIEWGLLPCPAVPAFQSSIDVVEPLERDLLAESNKHKVDQGASGAASTSPSRQRVPPVTVRNSPTWPRKRSLIPILAT